MADAINRAGTIAVTWSADGIGRLSLDSEHWASVEWSEKRQQWCIQDVEGHCLKHTASIHGMSASKEEAVALAEAMIRDGRMPSPKEARAAAADAREKARREALADTMVRDGLAATREEAFAQILRVETAAATRAEEQEAAWAAEFQQEEERKRVNREKRDRQPAVQRRRAQAVAQRDARMAGWMRRWEAEQRDEEAQPLYELFAEAFDLADPELWKSNSFAAFRPRLIIHLEAVIADLESNKYAHDRDARLARATEILAVLAAPSRLLAGE